MNPSRVAIAVLLAGLVAATPSARAWAGAMPETVVVPSGALRLTALIWRPDGPGPFPGVLFTHGSGPTEPSGARVLGPVFAAHGYLFLYLFRRGDGLSASQGAQQNDLLERERASKGDEARNRLQLRLLTGDHLDDVRAGLQFLQALPRVDARRVAVAGHSFGGQLALLAAESDGTLRAAVGFAPAPISWGRSPKLRERLLQAVGKTSVPILLLYAANDFSTAPGEAMAAELTRRGKPGALRIYPPVGKSPEEGHEAVHRAIPLWEKDVFEFLDRSVKRRLAPL